MPLAAVMFVEGGGGSGSVPRPDEFRWLAGIEDTFITAASPKTARTLDEYELTGHYQRWREDLDLFAELGVRHVRYGIPWHRINPSPGVWDFGSADAPLERLLELGIEPIVDLVHYGLPSWIEGAFLHPDFDRFMSEYATRVADRFRGRIRMYTPLNEPRITAWYCGKLGWWPPFKRSWRGFASVMLGLCRGIVASAHALKSTDENIVLAHVDATDLYHAGDESLASEVERRQEMVFLALDLISGRVTHGHRLYDWLLSLDVPEAALEALAAAGRAFSRVDRNPRHFLFGAYRYRCAPVGAGCPGHDLRREGQEHR